MPSDAHVEGLQIVRNGVVVDEAEWNTDIPIDGGEYTMEGKAPGFEAWSTKIVVGPANDKKSVNVPRFRARPDGGSLVPQPATEAPVTTVPPAEGGPSPASKRTAVIALSAGAALVVGGLAVGFLAKQKWAEAEDVCGADHVCDDAADRMASDVFADEARLRGNISTVAVGAGVVVVGVGAYLFLRAGSERKTTTSLRVQPSPSGRGLGLAVGGSF